ncbi:hypothetical protein [Microcoleus sp. herbarium14]
MGIGHWGIGSNGGDRTVPLDYLKTIDYAREEETAFGVSLPPD